MYALDNAFESFAFENGCIASTASPPPPSTVGESKREKKIDSSLHISAAIFSLSFMLACKPFFIYLVTRPIHFKFHLSAANEIKKIIIHIVHKIIKKRMHAHAAYTYSRQRIYSMLFRWNEMKCNSMYYMVWDGMEWIRVATGTVGLWMRANVEPSIEKAQFILYEWVCWCIYTHTNNQYSI